MSDDVRTMPVLPIRSMVLLPGAGLPVSIGRQTSQSAVEAALATEEKKILVVAQKDGAIDDPKPEDLHAVGTIALIKRMSRSGTMQLLLVGVERARVERFEPPPPHLKAEARVAPLHFEASTEMEALRRAVIALAVRARALADPERVDELSGVLANLGDPTRLVFLIASVFVTDWKEEQRILEAESGRQALELLHVQLAREVEILELRKQLTEQVRGEVAKEGREALLRRQIRALEQELGEGEGGDRASVDVLRKRLEEAGLPDEAKKEVEREIARLASLPAGSPETSVSRAYLELVAELPWKALDEKEIDLRAAQQILDDDHYDLERVKGRILEHLAVLKLNPNARSPILCFAGPPGVGKTSLGQSIARALGRKFERISLGGLHDEAELRGHRRTYVGAMPGRIIQALRRAGTRNPVLMLDEVDKLGHDFRGDPAAALLEILDPAQNFTFRDNYLDLPFDLSRVFFITTANTLDTIPRPLLDRFEMLRLSGYSAEEKVGIAKRYLVPRQITDAGLDAARCEIPDETLAAVIDRWTREAGVRQLERAIGSLARASALRFARGTADKITVRPDDLPGILGPARHIPELARTDLAPGVAAGLAWTETGGEVMYVECLRLTEGQGLTLTGQLGSVMQESARAAYSYLWSHAADLGIDRTAFHRSGIHVHVPAGATPKDGPSAGVTIAAALASLLTGTPVRADVAMTGEITLSGLVLPVGGIKDKVLAAKRSGLRRVILPKGNEPDLSEVPASALAELEITYAEKVEDVLGAALAQPAMLRRAI